MSKHHIVIKGACQNNLKGVSLDIPLNELIVVTGVSGSGKSSLAFDTIYAEGQRRYMETFSPYARQFFERMDKPKVTRIDGIPPGVAIDQSNPVRTSRSTVGTMTELNDHIKLLFARAAQLYCRGCGHKVSRDTSQGVYRALIQVVDKQAPMVLITFPVKVPGNFTVAEVIALLAKQGYTQIHCHTDQNAGQTIEVIQDRVRLQSGNRSRINEALDAAFKAGRGRVAVYPLDSQRQAGQAWNFSADLHCAQCDINYADVSPGSFSFNSPVGACETCKGFGRVIGIDYRLVIPDENKTLAQGALKPLQTKSYAEYQNQLIKLAKKRRVPVNTPWCQLSEKHKAWVIKGGGDWFGMERFFAWLESKSYRMHLRVLLSKYRSYEMCPECKGARLKADSLLWRLGNIGDSKKLLPNAQHAKSVADKKSKPRPGLCMHELMLLSIGECRHFFDNVHLPKPFDEATELLLNEIRTRLNYLMDVGLEYLTLDRQSRTLSGGEMQRINLTMALGASLTNTLFVLDEPSIGLHPRDIEKIIQILQKLRDAGNSVIVVEHDPQIMLAADRVLDIGPGPGEQGGKKVFFGTVKALLKSKKSLTAQYLTGRKKVSNSTGVVESSKAKVEYLKIKGACQNNLKSIDVSIPLGRLVCITGVSGSGKSTLVHDTLYNAICEVKGKAKNISAIDKLKVYKSVQGCQHIHEAVLIDQSPIGKTTRSNPATYMGVFEKIRKLFAAEPLAIERGYTAGTFSFNSGTGRCPRCGGNGFEHVEMQFLSDVYLRCTDCDGARYRSEVCEVRLIDACGDVKSIADVLEMTVSEAITYFADHLDIGKALEPLCAVGLNYLKLGQPVPTLSGGEAQRLKLAAYLTKASRGKSQTEPCLFIFDEPTTGLHMDDIAKLLNAFQQLIDQGHSLLVVEHNLEVIRIADWVIDLGPEGGNKGGQVIAEGTPRQIQKSRNSYTGKALLNYMKASFKPSEKNKKQFPKAADAAIHIRGANEHNLKNIDLSIPHNKLTLITGVSGSGKSTVAFDLLFSEGQRRYLETLNAYARQFVQPAGRPDVDAIVGIPPTVAIEQRTSRGGYKSTVATLTEIYHFLRLLFVKLGQQHCPDCNIPIDAQTPEAILAAVYKKYRQQEICLLAPLVVARKGYYTDLAEWAQAKGFTELRVDAQFESTDNWPRLARYKEHNIELPVGTIKATPANESALQALLVKALDFGNGVIQVLPLGRPSSRKDPVVDTYSAKSACPSCNRSFKDLDPRLFSFNSPHGWCSACSGIGLERQADEEESFDDMMAVPDLAEHKSNLCKACDGERLNATALAVRFKNRSINQYTQLSIAEAGKYLANIKLNKRETLIARDILIELHSRLRFLNSVGLSYLSLNRAAPTLSGGEAQRIRLAAQLGSNLRGVCYVLDEPTIGLHPHDNRMLLNTLVKLKDKNNTVVIVEHDEDAINKAEHIIDLGPEAGVNGGQVVAQGTLAQIKRNKASVTGRFLLNPLCHPLSARRPTALNRSTEKIKVVNATLNNLKKVNAVFPLNRLICITGVSGSGKSTLVREVLYRNLRRRLNPHSKKKPLPLTGCTDILGLEVFTKALEVDQTPIGKTPRSCPATYIGFWDEVRQLFAQTGEARIRGYTASRFSFNVKGGRCDACDGQGVKKVEMSFLPDVKLRCEVCNGARFNDETLGVQYKSRNIGEILNMSVDEAVTFFSAHVQLHRTLKLLQDVGLGYITLGQQSPTLSGGEAQRIKLVAELAKSKPLPSSPHRKSRNQQTLYVLDEPTIGLHMADVEKLIRVLHRLVDHGSTVLIIEHNLDIIAEADWVIDLGPQGGSGGGRIVAQGTPEEVARRHSCSRTGQYLKPFLQNRRY